jgi:macrolide-specific efflux system membrane fusion protein
VEQANYSVTAASQSSRAAAESVTAATTRVQAAKSALDRARRGGDTAKVTEAEAELESSQSALTQARSQSTQAASQEVQAEGQARDAEADLASAERVLADAQADALNLSLVAPFDAVVTDVGLTVGDTVGATSGSSDSSNAANGQAAAASGTTGGTIGLASMAVLEVTGSFDEADAVRLATDQSATVAFPALDGVTADGTVTFVSPTGSQDGSLVTYQATVTLDDPPADVRLGQTATIVVVTERVEDALYLPANAVTVGNASENVGTVRLVGADGATETVQVGVGLQGDTTVEITSGLEEGQSVLVSTDTDTGATSDEGGVQAPGGGGMEFGGGGPQFGGGGGPQFGGG